MALFFDYKVATDNKAETSCISWHPVHHILAVAAMDGVVTVHTEEGTRVEDVRIKRVDQVPCFFELA